MAERAKFDYPGERARPPRGRSRLGGAGALVAAAALIVFPSGHAAVAILGAVVVLAAWYLLAPTYAFALGHVALAAVLPEGAFAQGTGLVWMAAVETGLLGILLASPSSRAPTRFGGSESTENSSSRDDSDRDEEAHDPEEAERLAGSASRAAVGVGLLLGWTAVGGALAWASARSSLGLSAAGGLLVTVSALAAYGLHRYQLVSLGIVGDDDGKAVEEEGDDDGEAVKEEGDDDERGGEASNDDEDDHAHDDDDEGGDDDE
jgi:hypothetical protein